jgi:hypothetical protein
MNAVPPVRHGTDQDIKDAIDVYNDFTKRTKSDAEFNKLSPHDKITYYHRNSPDVVKKFPVVFRYMVETGQFHPKAMKRFIDKLKSNPYKTEEEYCASNANYIKFLYMATHSHYSIKEANQLWGDTKNALMAELKEFKDKLDEHRKKNDDMKSVNAYERRGELKKHIESLQATKDGKDNK